MTVLKSLSDVFTLRDGHAIPCVGFGTWQSQEGEVAKQAVKDALEIGYRHIDTAYAYYNERSVGLGIQESGLDRKDIFFHGLVHIEHHYMSVRTHSLNS